MITSFDLVSFLDLPLILALSTTAYKTTECTSIVYPCQYTILRKLGTEVSDYWQAYVYTLNSVQLYSAVVTQHDFIRTVGFEAVSCVL